ncbi:MAG: hypothetical protein HC819_08980 [Cyclobacteriaceae bacterium]|nr:hypothetical protein [Cyclobacteriaceae bacterium]
MKNAVNSTTRHIYNSPLRFSRWSNKAYAVFNSIGRQVIISFLAGAVRSLQTVKSTFAPIWESLQGYRDDEAHDESASSLDPTLSLELNNWITLVAIKQNSVVVSGQVPFLFYYV